MGGLLGLLEGVVLFAAVVAIMWRAGGPERVRSQVPQLAALGLGLLLVWALMPVAMAASGGPVVLALVTLGVAMLGWRSVRDQERRWGRVSRAAYILAGLVAVAILLALAVRAALGS
jgi:hypothetical protein